MITRRSLLRQVSLGAIASGFPAISLARADTDVRLVLVILRGAVDGLALAAPYGEGRYASLRGELALPGPGQQNGVRKLDELFGLHPSLQHTHALFREREALVVHAVASPYRARSHFDGQDLLESGAASKGAMRDGWLNRAIAPLGGHLGSEVAIALAPNTPLVLRGTNSVSSWAPSQIPDADGATLDRIEALYAEDEFFATRFAQAMNSQNIAGDMNGSRRRGNNAQQLKLALSSAAKFLTAPSGPTIAVVEAGGWDTHANQGATSGNLANRFAVLDEGLSDLQSGMGDNWNKTVVAVVTEFGRTVAINGTRGTDHGTGAAALLLGGAVNGGQVVTEWPGLGRNDLYEDRDLYPTLDVRSLFKSILSEHMYITDSYLEDVVFPDSAVAQPIEGLIRV